MLSTRRQKTKARKSREMDMMYDFDNMGILLGNENANPLERELANAIEGSINNEETESNSHLSGNTSQGNEIRHFDHEDTISRQDRLLETMETCTNEFNLRLSQEMDTKISMMHSQIKRAISSAFAERVILEIQNMVSSLASRNRDTEANSSSNIQENRKSTTG